MLRKELRFMISAGDLTKRITIQVNTPVRQADGSRLPVWTNLKPVWSRFITEGGKEFYAAQKLNAEVTAVIQIRYFPGLTTKHRILYRTRVFDILFHNNVGERNEEYLISAKEVV
jgi:SPP1 family predicted phage head-tail adaptor